MELMFPNHLAWQTDLKKICFCYKCVFALGFEVHSLTVGVMSKA